MYVADVGSNNQKKKDNKPNVLSWLDHNIWNDEDHGLTPQLGWIEDELDCILDTFVNIQYW